MFWAFQSIPPSSNHILTFCICFRWTRTDFGVNFRPPPTFFWKQSKLSNVHLCDSGLFCSVPTGKKASSSSVTGVSDKLRVITLLYQFVTRAQLPSSRLGEYAYAYCHFRVMVSNLDKLFRFRIVKKEPFPRCQKNHSKLALHDWIIERIFWGYIVRVSSINGNRDCLTNV
jgi:hypothetical protein